MNIFQSYLVVSKGSFEVGQGALDTAGQLGVVVAVEHLKVQMYKGSVGLCDKK